MKPKTICKFYGGSHLYGLNNEHSDIDVRRVFMHTDPAYILGTKRFDEERKQNDDEDFVMKELNHLMTLLKKSNSEAIETLFAPDEAFLSKEEEYDLIRDNKRSFINSKGLFNCLQGYAYSEHRLALGIRKGKIGGKRYANVQKYGFSPKNFVQLFRLLYLGIKFFTEDRITVNFKDEPEFNLLWEIKNNPEKFSKEYLTEKFEELDEELEQAYDSRQYTYKFNEELANEILLELYFPYLKKGMQNPYHFNKRMYYEN